MERRVIRITDDDFRKIMGTGLRDFIHDLHDEFSGESDTEDDLPWEQDNEENTDLAQKIELQTRIEILHDFFVRNCKASKGKKYYADIPLEDVADIFGWGDELPERVEDDAI